MEGSPHDAPSLAGASRSSEYTPQRDMQTRIQRITSQGAASLLQGSQFQELGRNFLGHDYPAVLALECLQLWQATELGK